MRLVFKDLEKGFIAKYLISTLCLVLIFAVSFAHSQYINRKISDVSKNYLLKITTKNAEILSGQIRESIKSIYVLSNVLNNRPELSIKEMVEILERGGNSARFVSIGVVLRDGSLGFTAYKNGEGDGSKLLIPSDWEYIHQTMAGRTGDDLNSSPARMINNEMLDLFIVPFYNGSQINGVVAAFYSSEVFADLEISNGSEEEGNYYITDKDGCVLVEVQSFAKDEAGKKAIAKTVDEISQNWMLKGTTGQQLLNAIHEGKSGSVEYTIDRQKLYLTYAPIDFEDLFLISLTPAHIAEAQSKGISENFMPVSFYFLVILMTVTIYFAYLRSQKLKRLERKMRLQSINDESYRIIMEHTNDIIFEYDTLEKTYLHTANFKKTFGYEPSRSGFLGSLEYDYIHPDDVHSFIKKLEGMTRENALTETEIRIINADGIYLWTRVYTLGIFEKNGKLAKIIGKIVNIDDKKREIEWLQKKAVMDSSSGVYNKQTTEQMISAFLENEGMTGRHALIIVDIDDFKSVNDEHGHRLGDAVISTLGSELNRIFRSTDIKGRIGGDEFMVLMKDIDDLELISQKVREVCSIFNTRELETGKEIAVSTSIGIALYDKDGSTFHELYEAADKALYNCKSIEKGTFSFYCGS